MSATDHGPIYHLVYSNNLMYASLRTKDKAFAFRVCELLCAFALYFSHTPDQP